LGTGDSPTFTALTLSNGQIVFPATQNASADANTLDDYEEGSWTPTLQDASLSDEESQAYDIQVGRYTKIGNKVYIEGHIKTNNLGTLAGASARIGGLPFTSVNTANYRGGIVGVDASGFAITGGQNVTGRIDPNTA